MKKEGAVIISIKTWIGWSASLLVMGVGATVFAFTTFSTKTDVKALEERTVKVLDTLKVQVDDIHKHLIKKGEK